MTLEAIYWLTLGIGLGLLFLSLLLGDILDLLPFEIDIGGSDFAAGPVFFAGVAAFGAGGLLGIRGFGLGRGGSIFTGIGAGLGFGAGTALLFTLLQRQEGKGAFDLNGLVGLRAAVNVAIGPGQAGRVTVTFEGMTRAFTARSDDRIAVGEEVIVRDVVGSQLTVARPAATPEG
jgi:hypothetical protein